MANSFDQKAANDLSQGYRGVPEEELEQMLALAERIRSANGGVLNEDAIIAVAEATGATPELVRVAVKLRSEKARKSLGVALREQYITLDSRTRAYVEFGAIGAIVGLFFLLQMASTLRKGPDYGIFGMLGILVVGFGVFRIATLRTSQQAIFSGAIAAIASCLSYAMFASLAAWMNWLTSGFFNSFAIIPFTLIGAFAGFFVQKIALKHQEQLGLKDPVAERQQMLTQLVNLQEQLRSNVRSVSFLSVDVAGSTKIKAEADTLNVEFTFNEYHRFCEEIAKRFLGRVHSTAGDGVTLAFDRADQAFNAARYMQAGLLEFNTFRNKIGIPLSVRAGVHSGEVSAPDVQDITTLNFASVIDIAAHLQKIAPAGGVAISEDSLRQIPGGSSFALGESLSANNVSAKIWIARRSLSSESGSTIGPPPLPVS